MRAQLRDDENRREELAIFGTESELRSMAARFGELAAADTNGTIDFTADIANAVELAIRVKACRIRPAEGLRALLMTFVTGRCEPPSKSVVVVTAEAEQSYAWYVDEEAAHEIREKIEAVAKGPPGSFCYAELNAADDATITVELCAGE